MDVKEHTGIHSIGKVLCMAQNPLFICAGPIARHYRLRRLLCAMSIILTTPPLQWSTYVASMLRGLGARPGRLHQATLYTTEGWLRLCRQYQPEREPDSESGLAHSFTVSSLAQVSSSRPLASHFMLVMDSWKHTDLVLA